MGERELAEDTGLARSAYMSSESALRTELLLDEALDTEETLLTLRDLQTTNRQEGNEAFFHCQAWLGVLGSSTGDDQEDTQRLRVLGCCW